MASNSEEPMETDDAESSRLPLPRADPAAGGVSEEPGPDGPGATGRSGPPEQSQIDEDVTELKVSLTVTEEVEPKKFKSAITKTLQSWANKHGVKGEFTATEISEDVKTAVIRVKPAAALPQLLELGGRELYTKELNTFSIKPIFENDATKTSRVDQKSSVKSSPNLSKEDHVKSKESSAEDDSVEPCLVALGPYWYMKNLYPDEIQRIEREHGVKITENVDVSIKADKKHANPKKAKDEFIKLVQSFYSECTGVSIPLKNVHPEEWKETLKSLQTTDHKCQITISSDQITVFGPQQYQTAIIKSLQRSKISTNLTDEERGIAKMYTSFHDERKTPTRNKVKLGSSIKDPLVIDGLPVETYYWEMITNQHQKELDMIKEKFNVRFKEAELTQDKMMIKVRYSRSEGNMQMESHGVRALLRLYQKVAALRFIKNTGTFEDTEESRYSSFESKGAAGKTDTPEEKRTKGLTEGGAVKRPSGARVKKDEKEEETCPVCLDTFTKKTRLKCKHEFCEECLEQSVKSQGPMCPVCKDVFGLVEGDQPPGTMRWSKSSLSLPGFAGCGTIDITYDIPNGTQTAKHPSPGRMYSGLHRNAYLPDNREGNEVLQLLKRAFDQKLTFTVGTSRTTGAENVVTWNDIHHKTCSHGGPQSFGYPDPSYLGRVKEELKAKGIK